MENDWKMCRRTSKYKKDVHIMYVCFIEGLGKISISVYSTGIKSQVNDFYPVKRLYWGRDDS